jgi:hypothetical protein
MRSLMCAIQRRSYQVHAHTQQLSHITSITQKLLASHGATAIRIDYDKGDPVAMACKIRFDDQELSDRLPVDWRAVFSVMRQDGTARRSSLVQAREPWQPITRPGADDKLPQHIAAGSIHLANPLGS